MTGKQFMGTYILADTPSGHKTLVFKDGPREIKIHSAYDPPAEAQRGVDGFSCGRANCITVFGIGLGYHVAALKKRFPESVIICVERDRTVADMAAAVFPELLEGVMLISGEDEAASRLEEVDVSRFRGMANFFHRPSYLLDRAYYDRALADIHRTISSKLSDLLTRFEFESRWVENIFRNLHKTFKATPVKNLFGEFKGIPGIIVSAGPSLRKNVTVLRELRDRAVIVAVDTSFKVLIRSGIVPHIVMTIDAQKHSLKHFLGTAHNGALLLADLVSYPRVTDYYQGPVAFSTTAKYYSDSTGGTAREATPVMDWIEKYMKSPGDIQSGGSVATSALDLLLNMGCRPIILAGQDLAYTGREIHCSGTHHNDDWMPLTTRFLNLDTINQRVIRKRKIKYVEAYGGNGEVVSDYVFDLYRGWFEDSALRIGIPLINATEGGARILDTVERSLSGLLKDLPSRRHSPGEIISRLSACGRQSAEDLKSALENALYRTSGILDLIDKETHDQTAIDIVMEAINEGEIYPLFAPFLRKTFSYLTRHPDLDPGKAAAMLATDIRAAAVRLKNLIGASLKNLEAL